jgi:hypothetical protein
MKREPTKQEKAAARDWFDDHFKYQWGLNQRDVMAIETINRLLSDE